MSRRHTPRLLEAVPRYVPPVACRSLKRGYVTREDATRALARLQRIRDVGERAEKREYRCAICGNFHLTSQEAT